MSKINDNFKAIIPRPKIVFPKFRLLINGSLFKVKEPVNLDGCPYVVVEPTFQEHCEDRCDIFCYCEKFRFDDGMVHLIVDELCPLYTEAFLSDVRNN